MPVKCVTLSVSVFIYLWMMTWMPVHMQTRDGKLGFVMRVNTSASASTAVATQIAK
jgi:hypothetical protein